MSKARELLFSVGRSEFEIQTFRAGGKGGQHQNKTDSGVRIIHRASGARGEGRDSRSQIMNKRAALRRLAASPRFQAWLKVEVARRTGEMDNIEAVANRWADDQMQSKYLKIESV